MKPSAFSPAHSGVQLIQPLCPGGCDPNRPKPKEDLMSTSAIETLPAEASPYKKGLSWKAALVGGVIVLGGSLGFGLLVNKIIYGEAIVSSAIVRSADPDYRIQLLERVVSRYPSHVSAWLQLGNAYTEAGRNALAASAYENFLELDPRSPDIWTKLGIQYAQTERPDQAIKAFDRAASLNPKHEGSRLYKGIVLLNAFNDLRGAIRSWMQVLETNPKAAAPDGTPLEEWISYCQTASSTKIAGVEENAE
jgi:lipopolysaccharide biosynthesis regulator YciM